MGVIPSTVITEGQLANFGSFYDAVINEAWGENTGYALAEIGSALVATGGEGITTRTFFEQVQQYIDAVHHHDGRTQQEILRRIADGFSRYFEQVRPHLMARFPRTVRFAPSAKDALAHLRQQVTGARIDPRGAVIPDDSADRMVAGAHRGRSTSGTPGHVRRTVEDFASGNKRMTELLQRATQLTKDNPAIFVDNSTPDKIKVYADIYEELAVQLSEVATHLQGEEAAQATLLSGELHLVSVIINLSLPDTEEETPASASTEGNEIDLQHDAAGEALAQAIYLFNTLPIPAERSNATHIYEGTNRSYMFLLLIYLMRPTTQRQKEILRLSSSWREKLRIQGTTVENVSMDLFAGLPFPPSYLARLYVSMTRYWTEQSESYFSECALAFFHDRSFTAPVMEKFQEAKFAADLSERFASQALERYRQISSYPSVAGQIESLSEFLRRAGLQREAERKMTPEMKQQDLALRITDRLENIFEDRLMEVSQALGDQQTITRATLQEIDTAYIFLIEQRNQQGATDRAATDFAQRLYVHNMLWSLTVKEGKENRDAASQLVKMARESLQRLEPFIESDPSFAVWALRSYGILTSTLPLIEGSQANVDTAVYEAIIFAMTHLSEEEAKAYAGALVHGIQANMQLPNLPVRTQPNFAHIQTMLNAYRTQTTRD